MDWGLWLSAETVSLRPSDKEEGEGLKGSVETDPDKAIIAAWPKRLEERNRLRAERQSEEQRQAQTSIPVSTSPTLDRSKVEAIEKFNTEQQQIAAKIRAIQVELGECQRLRQSIEDAPDHAHMLEEVVSGAPTKETKLNRLAEIEAQVNARLVAAMNEQTESIERNRNNRESLETHARKLMERHLAGLHSALTAAQIENDHIDNIWYECLDLGIELARPKHRKQQIGAPSFAALRRPAVFDRGKRRALLNTRIAVDYWAQFVDAMGFRLSNPEKGGFKLPWAK
jgi:hypothetical protein